jgi:hypothetical protein
MVAERFYFDVENGQDTIRDEEGVEAASLDEALAEARSVIDEMADEVQAADPSGTWTLVVRDAAGSPVSRIAITR